MLSVWYDQYYYYIMFFFFLILPALISPTFNIKSSFLCVMYTQCVSAGSCSDLWCRTWRSRSTGLGSFWSCRNAPCSLSGPGAPRNPHRGWWWAAGSYAAESDSWWFCQWERAQQMLNITIQLICRHNSERNNRNSFHPIVRRSRVWV